MKNYFAVLLVIAFQFGNAQVLLPTIGQTSQPLDTDQICYFASNGGSFDYCEPGPQVGDTMPDFRVFDRVNNPFTLSNSIQEGKYTLLISGSYTCPAFRDKVPMINAIITNYAAEINTYVVYQMEAHPATDTSLYYGFVHPTETNINQGILFDQPTTYGERKALIDTMNADINLYAPIIIDGPCNEFLDYFGPAPNNAYLVDTNGIIVLKHCWFDRSPSNIINDLNTILFDSTSTDNEANGYFTFALDNNDSIAYGNPGEIITFGGTFTNTSLTDDVIINLKRVANHLPDQSWASAMCIDVCLGTNVSSYLLHMPPNSSQHFSFYFFTGSAASGRAKLRFSNANNQENTVTQGLHGSTISTSINSLDEKEEIKIFPNPVEGLMTIQAEKEELGLIRIYNVLGQDFTMYTSISYSDETELNIDVSNLSAGIYYVKTKTTIKKVYKQ